MALTLFSPGKAALRKENAALREQLGGARLSNPIMQDNEQFVGFGDAADARSQLARVTGASAAALRVIRQRVEGLELGVYLRRFINGDFEDSPAFNHPLQRLLENPTANAQGEFTHSARQVWGMTVTQQQSVGESYLYVMHDGLGVPQMLQAARPGTLEPVVTAGTVTGYRIFASNSTARIIRPQDVIRFWEPDPYDLYDARGLLPKSADIVDMDGFATKRWSKFYQNDATPKMVFEAKDQETEFPTADEQEQLARVWTERFNRIFGKWQHRPAWVKPGYTIKQLTSEDEAASGVTFMQYARRTIFQQLGVSTALVGDVIDVNRASAETTRFTFDQNTIEPITVMIADALTMQLASQYPVLDENVRLIVKYRPFIDRDKEFELRRDEVDLRTKTRSINEVRTNREPEMKEAPWGDLPVGSFADTPYTGEEEELDLSSLNLAAPSEPEEIDTTPDDEEERTRGLSWRNMREHFSLANEWERQIQRDIRFTPKFRTVQRAVFRRQAEITIKRFLDQARTRAHDDLIDELFPLEGWENLFAQTTEKVRGAAFVASATEATVAITGRSFQMTKAARVALDEMNFKHITFINETTKNLLRANLADGIAAGESSNQIAARIAETFGTRRKDATRIARTEVATAIQTAQIEGYKQTGVTEGKQWNTSLDDLVRDSHTIDGQQRDNDDDFTLTNGAGAYAPSAESLEAEDRINCRCFVTPFFKEEV